jgi:hypothetical protein
MYKAQAEKHRAVSRKRFLTPRSPEPYRSGVLLWGYRNEVTDGHETDRILCKDSHSPLPVWIACDVHAPMDTQPSRDT